MKKLALLFTLFSLFYSGQDVALKIKKGSYPLFIINGVIGNENQLTSMDQKLLSGISVYKSNELPENLQAFSNFAGDGIIDITLNSELQESGVLSLHDLNLKHNLPDNNSIYVDGTYVTDNNIKIYKNAIVDEKMIDNKGHDVLNIWTLTESQRIITTAKKSYYNPLSEESTQ